jgi:hypothetical protein
MYMVFPPNCMGKEESIPWGQKGMTIKCGQKSRGWSKLWRVIAFQQESDITHVDAPSSITSPKNVLCGIHHLNMKSDVIREVMFDIRRVKCDDL